MPAEDSTAHHGWYVITGVASMEEAGDSVEIETYVLSATAQLFHVDSTSYGEAVSWTIDTMEFEDTVTVENDTIFGGSGSDRLIGQGGDDQIRGDANESGAMPDLAGQDTLYGGNDQDHLFGFSGTDWLYGGHGVDFLGGGADKDIGHAWRVLAIFSGHWHLRGYGIFVAEHRAEGRPIGSAGPWFPGDWPEEELGWTIWDEADEGRGYAREAFRAIVADLEAIDPASLQGRDRARRVARLQRDLAQSEGDLAGELLGELRVQVPVPAPFPQQDLLILVETRAVAGLLARSSFVQAQILPYSFQNVCLRGTATRIDALLVRAFDALLAAEIYSWMGESEQAGVLFERARIALEAAVDLVADDV